jgi:hypothetical protein
LSDGFQKLVGAYRRGDLTPKEFIDYTNLLRNLFRKSLERIGKKGSQELNKKYNLKAKNCK